MIYGFRERELILAFFEKDGRTSTEPELTCAPARGRGGPAPTAGKDDVLVICDTIYERTFEYDELLTGQPIFRGRMIGSRPSAPKRALALGVTGPVFADRGRVGPATYHALPRLRPSRVRR